MLMQIVNLQEMGNGPLGSISQVYLTMEPSLKESLLQTYEQIVGETQFGECWSLGSTFFSLL